MRIVYHDESNYFSLKRAQIIIKAVFDDEFYLSKEGENDCQRIDLVAVADWFVYLDYYEKEMVADEFYLKTAIEANALNIHTYNKVQEHLVIEVTKLMRNGWFDVRAWKSDLIRFALYAVGELCAIDDDPIDVGFEGEIVVNLMDERLTIWCHEGDIFGPEAERVPHICVTSTPIV